MSGSGLVGFELSGIPDRCEGLGQFTVEGSGGSTRREHSPQTGPPPQLIAQVSGFGSQVWVSLFIFRVSEFDFRVSWVSGWRKYA